MRRDRRIQLVGDGFADEELSVGIFLRPMTFHQLRGQASGSLVLRAAAVAWDIVSTQPYARLAFRENA